MKTRFIVSTLTLGLLGLFAIPLAIHGQSDNGPILKGQSRGDAIPGRLIVVLKTGATPAGVAARHGLAPDAVYSAAFNGFAGAFSAAQMWKLMQDSRERTEQGQPPHPPLRPHHVPAAPALRDPRDGRQPGPSNSNPDRF